MIRGLISRMQSVIDDWHGRRLELFEYEPLSGLPPMERHAVELAYHNYQGWHYEAWMRGAEPEQVARATRKTFFHNKGRNAAIEHLDEVFFKLQKGTGEFYSETLGMILDRLSILYLKWKYCGPQEGERRDALDRQFAFLSSCAAKLYEELLAGKKQILSFEKTKHFPFTEKTEC